MFAKKSSANNKYASFSVLVLMLHVRVYFFIPSIFLILETIKSKLIFFLNLKSWVKQYCAPNIEFQFEGSWTAFVTEI